jgi:hypothetical protein
MARPKKETVEFFPHMVEHGKTMFILESKWGNDGYAVWFKLLEKLGATDGHYIDCRDETTVVFLAAVCRVSEETLLAIFGILASLNAIDRDLWRHKLVYCQHLVENLEVVYQRRKMDMPTRERVILRAGIVIADINPVNTDSNTQSRVDESRVDEMKTTDANHSQSEATGTDAPATGKGAVEEKPIMTRSERVLRDCVVEKRMDIQRLFPHADITLQEELLVAKYRDKPVGADPWLLVLRWFQAVPLSANGARASPAGSLAEKVLEENRQAAREFCGIGGDA